VYGFGSHGGLTYEQHIRVPHYDDQTDYLLLARAAKRAAGHGFMDIFNIA
jgi:hypothetical protein